MNNFEEIIIDMGSLQDGDQVMGIDGNWHDIEILPIHKPERMFKINFIDEDNINLGFIKCSGDHLWTIYDNFNQPITIESKTIFDEKLYQYSYKVGKIDGPLIGSIEEIESEYSRCISIKGMQGSDSMLFEVITDKGEKIFTHNCMQRLICGQLGSVASRMALDDNQATTIDGTHKGAGMVKAQGIVSNIQYYFEQQKWIEDWFTKRGLTNKGWELHEDPNASIDANSIDLGDDEEINIITNKTVIEFNDIHKEVDNTKAQKFEEV